MKPPQISRGGGSAFSFESPEYLDSPWKIITHLVALLGYTHQKGKVCLCFIYVSLPLTPSTELCIW